MYRAFQATQVYCAKNFLTAAVSRIWIFGAHRCEAPFLPAQATPVLRLEAGIVRFAHGPGDDLDVAGGGWVRSAGMSGFYRIGRNARPGRLARG